MWFYWFEIFAFLFFEYESPDNVPNDEYDARIDFENDSEGWLIRKSKKRKFRKHKFESDLFYFYAVKLVFCNFNIFDDFENLDLGDNEVYIESIGDAEYQRNLKWEVNTKFKNKITQFDSHFSYSNL